MQELPLKSWERVSLFTENDIFDGRHLLKQTLKQTNKIKYLILKKYTEYKSDNNH